MDVLNMTLDPVSASLLRAAKDREKNMKLLASANFQTGARVESHQVDPARATASGIAVGAIDVAGIYARRRETIANGGWHYSPLAAAAFAAMGPGSGLSVCRELDRVRGRTSITGVLAVDPATLRARR